MNSAAFQLNKIRRLINTQGDHFEFLRQGTDDFNEPNGQTESVVVKGIYHETADYLSKKSSDSTTIRKKVSPKILCTWEQATLIKHTDQVHFNNKVYSVSAINNLSESNLVADVSLEEVQQSE